MYVFQLLIYYRINQFGILSYLFFMPFDLNPFLEINSRSAMSRNAG